MQTVRSRHARALRTQRLLLLPLWVLLWAGFLHGANGWAAPGGGRRHLAAQPAYSTVEVRDNGEQMAYYKPMQEYYQFGRVRLHERTIHVYLPPTADASEIRQFRAPLTFYRGHAIPDIEVKFEHMPEADPFADCDQLFHDPAMFYGTPWNHHVFHYFVDAWEPVFPTLDDFGLIDNYNVKPEDYGQHPPDLCDFQKRWEQNKVVLLTWSNTEHYKWGFTMEILAKQRHFIQDSQNLCFDRLIVGRKLPSKEFEGRGHEIKRLTWFIRNAAALHYLREQAGAGTTIADVKCDEPVPMLPNPRKVPIITYLGRGGYRSKRAVLNADEILQYITDNYDVQIERPVFEPLDPWSTIEEIHEASVVLGMHGAAFTNNIWQRPGACGFQFLPYGFDSEEGQNNAASYKNMIEHAGAKYFEWINPFPQNAFQWVREGGGPSLEGMGWAKPANGAITATLRAQQTIVNMTDFAPVLNACFAAAGVKPRSNSTIGQEDNAD